MPTLIRSCTSLLAITLVTGTALAGQATLAPAAISADIDEHRWNKPIALAIEVRTVERDAAFGLHVVMPVFSGSRYDVLLEGYGYEGEGELGLAGGGVIYRRALGSNYSLELNAFFEGLRSADGFAYPQVGVGAAITRDWLTLRANGYLPLRSKDVRRTGEDRWTEVGDNRVTRWSRDRFSERAPMRGFDVEMELRLPQPPSWIDPRLAVGYAYREAEDRPEVYAGPLVRTEMHFARYWTVEAEWRDGAHGADQEWRVGVRFQMLFGGGSDPANARAGERFGPAQRFPWPTVARGTSQGKSQRGNSRALAEPEQPAAPSDDCCNSGKTPLIFD